MRRYGSEIHRHDQKVDAIVPIWNKLDVLGGPMLYRKSVEPGRDIRVRSLMDEGSIVKPHVAVPHVALNLPARHRGYRL